MKYLIIGLGNPGLEYAETRHNIGFKVLDRFIKLHNTSFELDKYAQISQLKFKGRNLTLIKPNTFMNLSGKAVNYWMQKMKINIENILIITDDISLSFGALRMRKKGSDGGHNGLKDVQNVLGRNDYSRLRFGVGSNFIKGMQAEYVLSNFNEEEKTLLDKRLDVSTKMIEGFVTIGIDQTMSNFNGK